eukprot:scaffold10624_cov76-Skeletonema_marinoi.AAC.2
MFPVEKRRVEMMMMMMMMTISHWQLWAGRNMGIAEGHGRKGSAWMLSSLMPMFTRVLKGPRVNPSWG